MLPALKQLIRESPWLVLGIIDNDRDAIVPDAFASGSLVLDTLYERDDDLGKEITEHVPEEPVIWDDWVEEILTCLKGRVGIAFDVREAGA